MSIHHKCSKNSKKITVSYPYYHKVTVKLEPSKIGTTSFGSVKLKIWILQKHHKICYTVNQGCERERLTGGPTGQRDPLDSDTETGEKLVAGETR